MDRQRNQSPTLSRAIRGALASTALGLAGAASAQLVNPDISFQFSQTGFEGGGVIRGFVLGQDTNNDGKLYMMGAGGVQVFGYEPGDEVEYMVLTFENIDGRTFTQRYDRNVAGADAPESFFFGLSYNLDGGEFGDEPDEGISFGPLAPSTSYFMGPLFSPFVSPNPFPDTPLVPCGDPEAGVCAGVVTLTPLEPFPNIEVDFATFSSAPVPTTDELRFSFSQAGFPNGGRIHGTLAGRDLDGDGRLYSMPAAIEGIYGFPPGDEITSASVTFEDFDGGRTFTEVFDASEAGINEFASFFMGFAYDLDGGPLGDAPDEGFSLGPLAPSTSFFAGPLFSPYLTDLPIPEVDVAACGNPEDGVCAGVVSLVPLEPFPNIEVAFIEFSAGVIEMHPDPARVTAPYSGSWFDVNRKGEGIVMHVLPDGRHLVYWMTYDNAGNQRWFVGTGTIAGLTVTVDEVYATRGGLFGGAFDPDTVGLSVAGSLTIDFDGCDSGTLRYVIDGEEGSLDLSRLSAVSTLTCTP